MNTIVYHDNFVTVNGEPVQKGEQLRVKQWGDFQEIQIKDHVTGKVLLPRTTYTTIINPATSLAFVSKAALKTSIQANFFKDASGGGAGGGSINIDVLTANLSGGGSVINIPEIAGLNVTAIGAGTNLYNRNEDFTQAGAAITLLNAVTLANGDVISVFVDGIANVAASALTGTIDGDRLPGMSAAKKGGVPATGTPSGKYLKDDGTWATVTAGSVAEIDVTAAPYNADPTGVLDSTDAWQDAINYAVANNVKIVAPAGVYKIGGPLLTSVDGVNPNCQLYVPLTDTDATAGTLHIECATVALSPVLSNTSTRGGITFHSTILGSGTNPSILGASFSAAIGNKNVTAVYLNNVKFRTRSKTGSTHIAGSMSGFNMLALQDVKGDNIFFDTESNLAESVLPTNETYGFLCPPINNGGGFKANNVVVGVGYKYGLLSGEHSNINDLTVIAAVKGIKVSPAGHIMTIGKYCPELCVTNIDADGSTYGGLIIGSIETEHYVINAYALPAPWCYFDKDITGSGTAEITVLHNSITESGSAAPVNDFRNNYTGSVRIFAGQGATSSGGGSTTFLNLTGGGGSKSAVQSFLNLGADFSIKWDAKMTLGGGSDGYSFVAYTPAVPADNWAIIYSLAHANQFAFYSQSGQYTGSNPTTEFPATADTNWHSYEVLYDGADLVLKVDGVTVSTTPLVFNIGTPGSATTFYLSTRPTATPAQFGVKNIIITVGGVAKMILPLAQDALDISGNALDLTLTGSYAFA